MTRRTLHEYTSTIMEISDEDRVRLLTDTGKKLTITPTLSPDTFEINPNQFVGVVRLQSGLTLDLLPKVPLFNVMWMIAEVERLEKMDFNRLENEVTISTFDDILEPIATAFVDEVEHLLARGLYRAYIEQEDNLSTVRGRIDFQEDLNRNLILRHRTYCRFTEYSWDIPENQVIRQVIRQLARWGFSKKLSRRLIALDRQMEDIRLTNLRANDVLRFNYSRQSEHYRPVHRFCHLFLDGFSLSEGAGDSPFDGFLIDMNTLFERFVAIKLRQALTSLRSDFRVLVQHHTKLFAEIGTEIKPDILLQRGSTTMFAADTKYKKRNSEAGASADYYQMIAYCTVYGLQHGWILYPRHLENIHRQLSVIGSDIIIHETSIDLRESRESIWTEFLTLADQFVAQSGITSLAALAS